MVIAFTVLTLINTITETGTFWLYAAFGIIGLIFSYRVVSRHDGPLGCWRSIAEDIFVSS